MCCSVVLVEDRGYGTDRALKVGSRYHMVYVCYHTPAYYTGTVLIGSFVLLMRGGSVISSISSIEDGARTKHD